MANCLIIIDVQNGFINEPTNYIPERIVHLLHKKIFDYAICTRFKNYKGSPFERFIGWNKLQTPEEQEIPAEIEKLCSRVFEKNIYSCVNKEMLGFLYEKMITKVYLTGIDTDCCVLKSATDFFERNIECHVLTHYCASNGGSNSHEAAKLVMKRTIGEQALIDRIY